MICPKCGAECPDDALFCIKCGTKFKPKEASSVPTTETNTTDHLEQKNKDNANQNHPQTNKNQKKNLWIGIGIAVAIILIIVLIIVLANGHHTKTSSSSSNNVTNAETDTSYINDENSDSLTQEYIDKCKADLMKRTGKTEDEIDEIGFCTTSGVGVPNAHNSLCFVVAENSNDNNNFIKSNGLSVADSVPVYLYEYTDIKLDKNGNLLPAKYHAKTKTFSSYQGLDNDAESYLNNISDYIAYESLFDAPPSNGSPFH